MFILFQSDIFVFFVAAMELFTRLLASNIQFNNPIYFYFSHENDLCRNMVAIWCSDVWKTAWHQFDIKNDVAAPTTAFDDRILGLHSKWLTNAYTHIHTIQPCIHQSIHDGALYCVNGDGVWHFGRWIWNDFSFKWELVDLMMIATIYCWFDWPERVLGIIGKPSWKHALVIKLAE